MKNILISTGAQVANFERGNGAPVVFVHGALADARMWNSHCSILAGNYHAISFTQRYFGHIFSPVDELHPFGITTHRDDLIAFVEAIAKEPVHLVGWSYGSDIALSAVIKAPALFRSLFLYEPGFPGYCNPAQLEVFAADAGAMFGPIFAAVSRNDLEEGVRLLIDGSGGRHGYYASQHPEIQNQQLENAHTLKLQLAQAQPPEITVADLNRIAIPAMVAYGENTRALFRVVTQAAQAAIPGCQAEVIKDATHMLPMEDPERFSQLVGNFLQNL